MGGDCWGDERLDPGAFMDGVMLDALIAKSQCGSKFSLITALKVLSLREALGSKKI